MTTRTLRAFEYLEPRSVEEAVSMLSQHREAKLLAGGTDLLIYMKRRILTPKMLINLKSIPGLKYVSYDGEGLRIGALTTIREIGRSSIIAKHYQALKDVVENFGTVQTQYMATVGGNICNASPGADFATPLLALKAQAKIVGPKGERIIPLDSFFTGPDRSILEPDEVLIELTIPAPPPTAGSAFMKIGRVSVDLSKVNAAIALTVKDETCEDIGIAMGAVAPTPITARNAENTLKNQELNSDTIEKAAQLAAAESSPRTTLRSTAEYKRETVKILVKRCLKKALERSRGGIINEKEDY